MKEDTKTPEPAEMPAAVKMSKRQVRNSLKVPNK